MSNEIRAESGGFSLDLGTQTATSGNSSVEFRAVWSTAYVNDLPDSAFLYVEDGEKDSDGKTTPRSKRHFPVRDANGNVDLAHVRNALARIPQSNVPDAAKKSATAKAQKLLASANKQRDAADGDGDVCPACGHAAHDGDPCDVSGCDCDGDNDDMGMYAAANPGLELRVAHVPLIDIEVRDPSANPDGTWTMFGYAAVFDQRTTLYDGKLERVTEDVDPAAFDRVLRTQGLNTPQGVVHFNYGHDMLSVVAATDVPPGQPGWLDLSADPRGLRYLAKVSQDDPDAHRMAVKMRDGVVKQASFAFTIARDNWVDTFDGDRTVRHRRILEVGQLRDVCAVAQGAYSTTESHVRSYLSAIGQPVPPGMGASHVRAAEAAGVVAVSPSGGSAVSRRLNAAQLRGVTRHTKRRT